MDPFTQRMLERARARQEKIDQKLASSGQKVPKRKPLTENSIVQVDTPVKSPVKPSRNSKSGRESIYSPKKDITSPTKDIQQLKKEVLSPKKVIQDFSADSALQSEMSGQKTERNALRHNVKSRLDRLGILYSDKQDLSSPIHRTEQEFSSATPPPVDTPRPPRPLPEGKRKFGRLAALADTINNWEDDLTHHVAHPEPVKKATKTASKVLKDESTLDVSIHSLNDINTVLQTTNKDKETPKPINSQTFTKTAGNEPLLNKNIVAELESQGYQCVSSDQWRLVYDFTTTETADPARQEPSASTPSAAPAPVMAAMVAANPPTVSKKPSIKKYRAPTPPSKTPDENAESDKDKENNVLQREENDNVVKNAECCVQTKLEGKEPEKGSPVVKRLAPKLNGNVDRNSVLSKAALFEAGSPRAKDPAEMSLRERKALFEKNKGAAIVPKAPFGMAPSAKALHADLKDKSKPVHTPPAKPATSRTNSKESIPSDDNVSQTSVGGGIKGKLAALFSKEQTISETTIANKNKQERDKEMEMLQNRFNYKGKPEKTDHDSEDEQSENDPSENAPLMGSTLSLSAISKKPEIIANVPKVTSDQAKVEDPKREEVVATQPGKRRSSQDSPVVLSVLEDVKRIKVNNKKEPPTNGTAVQPSLYPHLSDIETDTSHTQEEYSDCGGSSEDNLNDKLNKSDNWAETSFGREVMNVVKKNNSSYNKAVRSDSETSISDMNSELDDCLDEALNDEESEGPTPPKINKNANTLSSKSFTYEEGSPVKKQFKSPLKMQPPTPATPRDRANELVHSVSFYRRMQNASSQPTTPLRAVRRPSPDRSPPPDAPAAVTVRRRVKELHAEINKQQTVISQASQALNLCAATVEFSGSTEQAEGERLLLLATHRRQACLHEAQRLQVEGAGPAAEAGMASLHIRGITIPLRRDYARKLHADDATGHHAVCLLKCRDRVLASSMQLTQPPGNSLHFPDHIRMEGLAEDFKVTIEVYLLPATKELLPHDVKYHITNKKSGSKLLTPKSKAKAPLKAPSVQSPGGPLTVRSPQFQPHGYCIFALPQASRDAFTLNKVPAGSPLDGSIQLRIEARVRVPPPPPHAAFLTAFDDVSGLGAWHRRWFVLNPPRLAYWKYPDDVNRKMSIGDIDLSTVVSEKVTKASRDLCARPNTLLLEVSVPEGLLVPDGDSLVYFRSADGRPLRRHLLAADTPRDRDAWLAALNAALHYVRCSQTNDD